MFGTGKEGGDTTLDIPLLEFDKEISEMFTRDLEDLIDPFPPCGSMNIETELKYEKGLSFKSEPVFAHFESKVVMDSDRVTRASKSKKRLAVAQRGEPIEERPRKLQRKNNWREKEKVFLSALTISFFAQRHSLKVGRLLSQGDQSTSRHVTVAWQKIHSMYDKARQRENEIKGDNMPFRSANALRKKWKDTGDKKNYMEIFEFDEEDTPESITKLLKFREMYNKDNILTCTEEKYETLKQQLM